MDLIDSLIYSQPQMVPSSLRQPYDYLAAIPGTNGDIRTQFIRSFNDSYFSIDNHDTIATISEVITVFHNSSLLIDDIEDGSEFRRGRPAAHTKYGVASTLNCGNMMYFVALQTAQQNLPQFHPSDNKNEIALSISNILVEELLNLHHGQGLDIHWRDHLKTSTLPSIQEYMEMIMNKTGGLFRLAVKLLGVFSTPPDQRTVLAIANLFGIVFQIRDDVMNLVDDKYSHMKGMKGEDLVEGKLSLPILHCLHSSTNDSPVTSLLYHMDMKQRQQNPQLVEQAVEYMKVETKSLQYAQDLLRLYGAKIKQLVGPDTNSFLVQIVDKLLNSI
ncbi:Geranylgeranyl pyrophosphate synthase [Meyerozyma sp. JA9]|nr:Geranylgeranyl pyrophosphate synthase [Meyerozyma sp. JA9]